MARVNKKRKQDEEDAVKSARAEKVAMLAREIDLQLKEYFSNAYKRRDLRQEDVAANLGWSLNLIHNYMGDRKAVSPGLWLVIILLGVELSLDDTLKAIRTAVINASN